MDTPSRWIPALYGLLLSGLVLTTGPATAGISHDWEWVNPSPQAQGLEDFSVVDSNIIYAVGVGGSVLRSDDGGLDWHILPTGNLAWLLSVDFTDELTGTIVGEEDLAGIILRTTDGVQSIIYH